MTLDLPPSLWPRVHAAAAGEGWPPPDDAAAERFLAQASREGLLPLLFESPDLPPAVQQALARQQAQRRLGVRRAEILQQALDRLGARLAGEAYLLIKGADYRQRLYPRPELRPMQDLDVLVRPERHAAVCARLAEAGLSPRLPRAAAARVSSHYERAFTLDGAIVEVHRSFLQPSRARVDYEGIWQRRVPCAPAGAARLEDADALAAHALSLAKDEFSAALVRYVDLWLMLRQRPELSARAAARAREWGTVRAFYGALHQAMRLFPELRGGELEALADALLSAPVRAFLGRFVLPPLAEQGRERVVTRGRQLWRKLWLIDGVRLRAGFGLEHALATLRGRRLS